MSGPRAESAHYDAGRNRVIIRLTTGVEIGFAPRDVEGLQQASVADLRAIEVEAFGLGIHFPALDADLYVPALLEGVLGSKRWMAARLGAAGDVRVRQPRPRLRGRTASAVAGRGSQRWRARGRTVLRRSNPRPGMDLWEAEHRGPCPLLAGLARGGLLQHTSARKRVLGATNSSCAATVNISREPASSVRRNRP